MTPIDREMGEPGDAQRFERLLLESARADELPSDVNAAWLRFGAALGGAAAASAPLLHTSAGHAGAAAWQRTARAAAAKWLVLGALAGSALTALGMSRGRAREGGAPAPVSSASLALRGAPAVSAALPPAQPGAAEPNPVARDLARETPRGQVQGRGHEALARASSAPRVSSAPVSAPSSTLGAQVELLDAARTAISAGAFGEALGLTAQYQRDFPAGELTPDAEVVALEALAGRGERAALEARAARFLARYPTDPHAARVRALVQR